MNPIAAEARAFEEYSEHNNITRYEHFDLLNKCASEIERLERVIAELQRNPGATFSEEEK